jgi:hypothetical protein
MLFSPRLLADLRLLVIPRTAHPQNGANGNDFAYFLQGKPFDFTAFSARFSPD